MIRPAESLSGSFAMPRLMSSDIASKSVYLASYGETDQEALGVNDTIYSLLKDLKKKETILEFSSIGALVQSKEIQNQKEWKRSLPKIKDNCTT